jgi:hypothetical protein
LLKHGGIDPPRLQVHPVAFGTAGRKPCSQASTRPI